MGRYSKMSMLGSITESKKAPVERIQEIAEKWVKEHNPDTRSILEAEICNGGYSVSFDISEAVKKLQASYKNNKPAVVLAEEVEKGILSKGKYGIVWKLAEAKKEDKKKDEEEKETKETKKSKSCKVKEDLDERRYQQNYQQVISILSKRGINAKKVSAWYDNEIFWDDMADTIDDNSGERYGANWKVEAPAIVIANSIEQAENILQNELDSGEYKEHGSYASGFISKYSKHPDVPEPSYGESFKKEDLDERRYQQNYQQVISILSKRGINAKKVSAWYDNEIFWDDMADTIDDNSGERYGANWKVEAPAIVIANSIEQAENILQNELDSGEYKEHGSYASGFISKYSKHPDVPEPSYGESFKKEDLDERRYQQNYQQVISILSKRGINAKKVSAWYDNEIFWDDMADTIDDNSGERYGANWKVEAPAIVIANSIEQAENILQNELDSGEYKEHGSYASGFISKYSKHPDVPEPSYGESLKKKDEKLRRIKEENDSSLEYLRHALEEVENWHRKSLKDSSEATEAAFQEAVELAYHYALKAGRKDIADALEDGEVLGSSNTDWTGLLNVNESKKLYKKDVDGNEGIHKHYKGGFKLKKRKKLKKSGESFEDEYGGDMYDEDPYIDDTVQDDSTVRNVQVWMDNGTLMLGWYEGSDWNEIDFDFYRRSNKALYQRHDIRELENEVKYYFDDSNKYYDDSEIGWIDIQ